MKVTLTKPTRVNALAGTVEVDETEAARLFILGVAEPVKEKETATAKRETRKKTK